MDTPTPDAKNKASVIRSILNPNSQSSIPQASSSQQINAQKIPPKLMTVCFLIENNKVLLGMKKRGFGQGRWNGFGGKLHDDETIFDAAKREILEEVGITVNALEERGYLIFKTKDRPQDIKMHIFVAIRHVGEPKESDEMRPQWFDTDKLPLNEMWSSDAHWLPQIIAGQSAKGEFTFDEKDNVIEHKVEFYD